MFWAELCEIADSGGSAVLPRLKVVGVVVEGVVVAAGEDARAVPQLQRFSHRFGESITGATDFQGCSVAGVEQDPAEGFGAAGDELAGHRGGNGPVTVELCRF